MSAERIYEARLMQEGEEIDVVEATPEGIASYYGLDTDRVAQLCQWADEEACAQGIATGPASSVVIEPGGE